VRASLGLGTGAFRLGGVTYKVGLGGLGKLLLSILSHGGV
jgi:hypothetical protein